MTDPVVTTAPTVSVNGTPLGAPWVNDVAHLRIERALGLMSRATLRFFDVGYGLSTTNLFKLGAQVDIALHDGTALLSGMVTGVNLEQDAGDIPQLSVVVHDAAYALARKSQIKTFLNSSFQDILTQTFSGHGLSGDMSGMSTASQEYILQSGSDLAFVNTITERLGLVWWIEPAAPRAVRIRKVGTFDTTVELKLGDDLTAFSVQASGLRPSDVQVSGWDPATQSDLVGQPTKGVPDMSTFVTDYLTTSSPLGAAMTVSGDRNPSDQGDAQNSASVLYGELVGASVVARGSGDINAAIAPGVRVKVSGSGPASGHYVVSEVEHVFSSRGFDTRFVAGRHRPTGLVDTLGPDDSDPGLTIPGLVVAIVTDVNDPDKAGRVKVKYAGVGSEIGSPWARIVTLGAGNNRGVVFQPEVTDEVLVGFEHGDSRRPVVLGGLFSAKNTLPAWGVEDNKVATRRITSAKGHIIEFSDGSEAAQSHVLLKLNPSGHRLRLGDDRFDIELAAGKPLTIKSGDAQFSISATGDVTIEGNNITIKAKQSVSVEGTSAKLKGTADAGVEAASVSVKAQATAAIEGGATTTIKGAMVAIN